jgi:hypothetical protein
MIEQLTHQILRLKEASADPINVFIDSPGGSADGAAILAGMLKSTDQRGRKCWINSVVTGYAASAAAHLLAIADYAIAYKHSKIHFHGAYKEAEDVTAEAASDLLQSLSLRNNSSAIELAQSAFGRFLHLYSHVAEEIPASRTELADEFADYRHLPVEPIDVAGFAFTAAQYVTPPAARLIIQAVDDVALFWAALEAASNIEQPLLTSTILDSVRESRRGDDAELQLQFRIFAAVCIARLKANPAWDLASEDFVSLKRDFDFVSIAAAPTFQTELLEALGEHQALFMSSNDLRYFSKFEPNDLDSNPKLRARYDRAVERAYAAVKPLWFFIVALFRRLNVGENPITPDDAWWLGIVDEVLGTTLIRRQVSPEYRQFLEQVVD